MTFFPGVDLRQVKWPPTLQLHLIRALAAGVVWALLTLLMVGGQPDAPTWWAMPLIFPLVYFIGLPVYLAIAKVSALFGDMGKAFGGFIVLALALGIVVGDPLVYLLHQQRPDLVPVERFRLVNFATVLFVH